MIAIDYYRNYCPNGRPLLLLAWLGTAWSIGDGGHRIALARAAAARAPFFFLDDVRCRGLSGSYVRT